MGLSAVVFDVDGTLVDSERDGHRVAFNRAFADFSLPYRWDEDVYGRLLRVTGGQRRIDGYLAEQGVAEDERARLAPALHRHKTEILRRMIGEGALEPRPGRGPPPGRAGRRRLPAGGGHHRQPGMGRPAAPAAAPRRRPSRWW